MNLFDDSRHLSSVDCNISEIPAAYHAWAFNRFLTELLSEFHGKPYGF